MAVPKSKKASAQPTKIEHPAPQATMLQPDVDAAAEQNGTPWARHNHPFLLRHHPGAWDIAKIDGEDHLVPDLVHQVLRPGVNGMPTLKRGETMADAVVKVRQMGEREHFTYIDPSEVIAGDMLPAGVPAGGYRRKITCRDTRNGSVGARYVTAWDVPIATLPGEPQAFRFDRERYDRWRLHLVESGQVTRPLPQVVQRLVARYGERVNRASARPYPTEEMRKRRMDAAKAAKDAADKAASREQEAA